MTADCPSIASTAPLLTMPATAIMAVRIIIILAIPL
jgi:hypothetical protein